MDHGSRIVLVGASLGLAACSAPRTVTVGCDGTFDAEASQELAEFVQFDRRREKAVALCAGTWTLPSLSGQDALDVRPVEGAEARSS